MYEVCVYITIFYFSVLLRGLTASLPISAVLPVHEREGFYYFCFLGLTSFLDLSPRRIYHVPNDNDINVSKTGGVLTKQWSGAKNVALFSRGHQPGPYLLFAVRSLSTLWHVYSSVGWWLACPRPPLSLWVPPEDTKALGYKFRAELWVPASMICKTSHLTEQMSKATSMAKSSPSSLPLPFPPILKMTLWVRGL